MSNCLQVSDPEFFELCPRNEGHKPPDSMWDSKLITTEWKQDGGRLSVGERCEQKLAMFCPTRPSMLVSKCRNVEKEGSWLGEDTMPLGLCWDSWLVQGRHWEVRRAPEDCGNDLKI